MSYNTIVTMAGSQSLTSRVAAAAAQEGASDPVKWAQSHVWLTASQPGWDTAWESALDTFTLNQNPDTGQRGDVITDGMILSAVQEIMAEEAAVVNPGP